MKALTFGSGVTIFQETSCTETGDTSRTFGRRIALLWETKRRKTGDEMMQVN